MRELNDNVNGLIDEFYQVRDGADLSDDRDYRRVMGVAEKILGHAAAGEVEARRWATRPPSADTRTERQVQADWRERMR